MQIYSVLSSHQTSIVKTCLTKGRSLPLVLQELEANVVSFLSSANSERERARRTREQHEDLIIKYKAAFKSQEQEVLVQIGKNSNLEQKYKQEISKLKSEMRLVFNDNKSMKNRVQELESTVLLREAEIKGLKDKLKDSEVLFRPERKLEFSMKNTDSASKSRKNSGSRYALNPKSSISPKANRFYIRDDYDEKRQENQGINSGLFSDLNEDILITFKGSRQRSTLDNVNPLDASLGSDRIREMEGFGYQS